MKSIRTTKRLFIVLAAATVLVASCYSARRPILMWAFGIHQPRVESKASLLQAAKKYKLCEQCLVTVAPVARLQLLNRFYKSIPEAILFNKAGNSINYKASSADCNAGLFSFISRMDKNISYPAGDTITLATTISDLRDLNGNTLPATYLDKGADFYLLISWADYTGKLNKDHVSTWQQLANENNRAKIQVIEVNFDIQLWWPQPLKDSLLKSMVI